MIVNLSRTDTMKASRLIGLLFMTALAVVLIGCGTDGGSGPTPDFNKGKIKKLAKCTPQSTYIFVGKMIGPSGGSISAGKHKLEIPRGALRTTVFISMEIGSDTTNSVQMRPEGLVFAPARPAKLTLDYGNCASVGVNPASIVYTTNQLQIIQMLLSIDDKQKKKVSAPLHHFSRYAVAY